MTGNCLRRLWVYLLTMCLLAESAQSVDSTLSHIDDMIQANLQSRWLITDPISQSNVSSIASKLNAPLEMDLTYIPEPTVPEYDFEVLRKRPKKAFWWTVAGVAYWSVGAIVGASTSDPEKEKNARLVTGFGLGWIAVAGGFLTYYQGDLTIKQYIYNRRSNQQREAVKYNDYVSDTNRTIFRSNSVTLESYKSRFRDSLNTELTQLIATWYDEYDANSALPEKRRVACWLKAYPISSLSVITSRTADSIRVSEIPAGMLPIDSVLGTVTERPLEVSLDQVHVSGPWSGWVAASYFDSMPIDNENALAYVASGEATVFSEPGVPTDTTLNLGDTVKVLFADTDWLRVQVSSFDHHRMQLEHVNGIMRANDLSRATPSRRYRGSEAWVAGDVLNLRDGPSTGHTIVHGLTKGDKLKVHKVVKNWAVVTRDKDDLSEAGWVYFPSLSSTFVEEPLQKRIAKQVDASGYVETVSLSPIDYLVHLNFTNKTSRPLLIQCKVEVFNFDTPGGLFFDAEDFSVELRANGHSNRVWRPSYAIGKLRQEIRERGSDLNASDISSLRSSNFGVDVEIVSIK